MEINLSSDRSYDCISLGFDIVQPSLRTFDKNVQLLNFGKFSGIQIYGESDKFSIFDERNPEKIQNLQSSTKV